MIFFLITLDEEEKNFVSKLYKRLTPMMYGISMNTLGNKEDSEEAISQTFLKIMENIEKISKLPCPQIDPYCVSILKNENINILRKRKNDEPLEKFDPFLEAEEKYLIEENFLLELDLEKLVKVLDGLEETEKELIILRFVKNLKYKEISEVFGISEEAAKKRGQRILEKIKQSYKEGDSSDI